MMRRVKLYNSMDLIDAWNEYLEDHPEDTWQSVYYVNEDEEEVDVLSGDMFWDLLLEHWATFKYNDPVAMYACARNLPYPSWEGLRDFRRAWSDFVAVHPEYAYLGQMLDRRDYDPLENYDRKEDGGWKDTNAMGKRTRTTDDDATHSMEYAEITTTTTNDPKLKTKTTGYVYPDDGGTAVADTESITEPVRASVDDVDTVSTTTPTHTDSSYVEGNLVVTDDAVTDTITRLFQSYHVHGNIGVTTAAQMIEGEMRVRMRNVLPLMIMDEFIKEHMTLRKEVRYYDD